MACPLYTIEEYNKVCNERDALRAELAKAKEGEGMSEESILELLGEIDRLGYMVVKRKETFLDEIHRKVTLPSLLLQKVKKEAEGD